MTEQHIQSKILSLLKTNGIYSIKTVVTNKSGVPDILCCMPHVIREDMVGETLGIFTAIEVKSESGVVSPLQKYNIDAINSLGGNAFVARNADILFNLYNIIR